MSTIDTIQQLEQIYGSPAEAAILKVTSVLTSEYRAFIEASPFLTLATSGPEGLDCSPRGDAGSVVKIADDRTLHLPDRRGNNRIDSLRNIIRDPRVALLFLIPGSVTTLRVNGRASLDIAPNLLRDYSVDGKDPRSVIVVNIDEVYFQCGRAILRSELWNPDRLVATELLPTPGTMLAKLSNNKVGGEAYDKEWPTRAANTLW